MKMIDGSLFIADSQNQFSNSFCYWNIDYDSIL